MEQFHAENAANPDFNEVLQRLIDISTRRDGAITRATCRLMTTRLMELASNRDANPQVTAEATEALRTLSERLANATTDAAEVAHRHALREDIQRFLERPDHPRTQPRPPAVPPGPPIGD
jgi:RecB family exonuclease